MCGIAGYYGLNADRLKLANTGALVMHPGAAPINVHLGRLSLRQKNWAQALTAYRGALAVDPFDEEVHLGLLKAADALHDATTRQRAEQAGALLLKATPEQLLRMANELSHDQPVPTEQAPMPPSASGDAG